MKRVFYVVICLYMFYRVVYGKAVVNAIEVVKSSKDGFFKVKDDITVICNPADKAKQVTWIGPKGVEVSNVTSNHVFAHEYLQGKSSSLVLTISGAEIEDSGVYSCKSGDVTTNVSLCIFDPAEFVDPATELTLDLGRSMTFTCPVKGHPEPRFSWFKNSIPITDEDEPRYRMNTRYTFEGKYEGQLTVVSLKPEDSGVYTCEIRQESAHDSNCSNTNSIDITLNVRHVPIFDDNDTLVYAQRFHDVELICSANAYPSPTYKWYRDDGDVSYRQDGKLIEASNGKNQSLLVVNSGKSFGRYRCLAQNDFGSAEKYFTLKNMRQPGKPSEVTYKNASDHAIELQVIWDSETNFPVDQFGVQYKEGLSNIVPKDSAGWINGPAKNIVAEGLSNLNGVTVTLNGLSESTDYWVRLYAANKEGRSAWTTPVFASTVDKVEETDTEDPEEEPAEDSSAPTTSGPSDSGMYFGIFFAGGILVVAVVCMFAMRMVK